MFDIDFAAELIGKHMIIGISFIGTDDQIISQHQLHGVVTHADSKTGIMLLLMGDRSGEEWIMPPDTTCITKAQSGIYTLASSGERVENPDYLCTWHVHQAPSE
jgi:hypothetical protein